MRMTRPKKVILNAFTNIKHVAKEICSLSGDIEGSGVCIVKRYHLRMEDIKWRPRAQQNYLHGSIIATISRRDEYPPFPPREVLPTAAANMVNRLLDMLDVLDPHIKVLGEDRFILSMALDGSSVWNLCRGLLTGQHRIDDQVTCDLVDRWACHRVEDDNDNEWGVAMERARECIAEAKDIIRKAPVVAKAK